MSEERDYSLICRHYTRTFPNGSCAAGIDYTQLREMTDIKNPVSICMGRCSGCPHYDAYSLEEILTMDKAREQAAVNAAIGKKFIIKKTNGKRGKFGTMPCPVCKTGTLNYSANPYTKGSIAAHCSTPNCILIE